MGLVAGGRGAKADAIKQFIRSRTSETFRVEDIRQAVPAASDVYIREVLRKLRAEGALSQIGRGRNAEWQRSNTNDFWT